MHFDDGIRGYGLIPLHELFSCCGVDVAELEVRLPPNIGGRGKVAVEFVQSHNSQVHLIDARLSL